MSSNTGDRRAHKAQTIIFLGISGSGKGTQAERVLKALPGSKNISSGAAFRRIAGESSLIGRYVHGIISRGGLMSYWAAAYIWLNEFFQHLHGDEHLVFDGAPRRIEEARMMDDCMRDIGRPLPQAIYIHLSESVARERLLLRSRHDDNRRAISRRFAFFHEHVGKVIRYYARHNRLITVNGDREIEEVWGDIKKALKLS